MKYNTIIFDLYHTLVKVHTNETNDATWMAFASYLSKFGIDSDYELLRGRFFQYEAEARTQTSNYIYPEIDITDVFDRLFQEMGKHYSKEMLTKIGYEFRCCSRSYIELFDGVIPLLEKLRQNHCQVILLSNAQRCFTYPEIQLLKLEPYFDAIYLSSDYRCMKPDPNFFELVFQNHDFDITECIMIGDSIESDIEGADVVGIDSLLLGNGRILQIPTGSRCIGVLEGEDRMELLPYLVGAKR